MNDTNKVVQYGHTEAEETQGSKHIGHRKRLNKIPRRSHKSSAHRDHPKVMMGPRNLPTFLPCSSYAHELRRTASGGRSQQKFITTALHPKSIIKDEACRAPSNYITKSRATSPATSPGCARLLLCMTLTDWLTDSTKTVLVEANTTRTKMCS